MFKRIFVANRGEVACRIIRAIHKLGAQAVLPYSVVDKDAAYLKTADEAICIGDAPVHLSYLNQDAILQAALQTDCQALHPGFGFLSENAFFANRCNQQKLKFIGPRAKNIRLMGDKSLARTTMERINLPGLPGSSGIISSIKDAEICAKQIGYPLLLKASAGGGGKGIRLVENKNQLKLNFISASNEADKSFGNNKLYIEKYINFARHIEFQILADMYGNIIHLGERECSIQRNHQKLLEEAPAFGFSELKRQKIGLKICKALKQIGYEGAGTVEFLLDKTGKLYFMEMNTRLQVEHSVTELVTDFDIVSWQIRIASGEKLKIKQREILIKGHAIECRINAEDPTNNFKPSPGTITLYNLPEHSIYGPLRLDTHIVAGNKITSFYDSMIAKLTAFGKDRTEAIKIMNAALKKMKIKGIKTTKTLQQNIINNKKFIHGNYNCSFLQENANIIDFSGVNLG